MNKTKEKNVAEGTITMTMEKFIEMIGAGRYTANKIAEQAEAKIYIGKRVLINAEKVKAYLNDISE